MVPNVYCITQPCKLYKYTLATPIPLATLVEATGVEGGVGDVPFATLDRRMMTHTTKISEAPHSALPHHAMPLCPLL